MSADEMEEGLRYAKGHRTMEWWGGVLMGLLFLGGIALVFVSVRQHRRANRALDTMRVARRQRRVAEG